MLTSSVTAANNKDTMLIAVQLRWMCSYCNLTPTSSVTCPVLPLTFSFSMTTMMTRKPFQILPYVTLCMDMFYVQGHPFFHTISWTIQFRTVASINSQKEQIMLRETKAVLDLYETRSFHVPMMHCDMEFECNKILPPTQMNTTAADDHVGNIE